MAFKYLSNIPLEDARKQFIDALISVGVISRRKS
jgi:hypothetical protein